MPNPHCLLSPVTLGKHPSFFHVPSPLFPHSRVTCAPLCTFMYVYMGPQNCKAPCSTCKFQQNCCYLRFFHCYHPGKPAWINSSTLCLALQDQALGWMLVKPDGRSSAKQIKPEDVFLTLVLFFPAARGGLQPWSQGVIAVVVFLVLLAIAFVVNRFWCKEKV